MRWKAHDNCIFNTHTSKPDRGEFLGYDRCPKGFCRVLLNRLGFKTVPTKSLTRKEEAKHG